MGGGGWGRGRGSLGGAEGGPPEPIPVSPNPGVMGDRTPVNWPHACSRCQGTSFKKPQYSVMACMGKESKEEWIYVYV